jgi:hypothetical protein
MTEEKRTIQINPELFALSSSRTRKKREPREPNTNPIHVRNPKQESNKTIRNRILKYIREQQEINSNKYDDLPLERSSKVSNTSYSSEPQNNDFESSLEFMKSFSDKAVKNNETIKNQRPEHTNVLYVPSITNSLLNPLPEHILEMKEGETQTLHLKPAIPNMHQPVYGCMKGGQLPTYKSWKNQTQKIMPSMGNRGVVENSGMNSMIPFSQPTQPIPLENMTMTSLGSLGTQSAPVLSSYPSPMQSSPFGNNQMNMSGLSLPPQMREMTTPIETMNRIALMKEMQKRNEEIEKAKQNIVRRKQKKILRRTYRVGKSKKYPRVSVLISNKTIRKNITSKAYEMKQVPLEDVRKTLIRKGFIKAGSGAPVDVLRKMYETMNLMCGEVENHNPDYLLHNYMNHEL